MCNFLEKWHILAKFTHFGKLQHFFYSGVSFIQFNNFLNKFYHQ